MRQHGWHYYWKATNLAGLSDAVINIVAEHAYRATSPRSYAAMFHMGGAAARTPRDATAYPGRDVDHNIVIDAAWLPEPMCTPGLDGAAAGSMEGDAADGELPAFLAEDALESDDAIDAELPVAAE